jgi:hypothetical protein
LPFFSTPKKVTITALVRRSQQCTARCGALGGNRTRDLSLTKGVLYH